MLFNSYRTYGFCAERAGVRSISFVLRAANGRVRTKDSWRYAVFSESHWD